MCKRGHELQKIPVSWKGKCSGQEHAAGNRVLYQQTASQDYVRANGGTSVWTKKSIIKER